MGGPMSTHEEHLFPWLAVEKKMIEMSIARGKAVLGICLGAQLIASALGARVYENKNKEIGWFPVTLTPQGRNSPLLATWPLTFQAFHWHGDTFDIPFAAAPVAFSAACPNLAFTCGASTVALQFHLESTADSIVRLISNCRGEMTPGPFVQDAEEIMKRGELPDRTWPLLHRLLDAMERSVQ
jgi:GMP synthase (glutamine-hydrolysing)